MECPPIVAFMQCWQSGSLSRAGKGAVFPALDYQKESALSAEPPTDEPRHNHLGIRERLRLVVDDPHSVAGRVFAALVQVMIVVSLLALAFETLPNLTPQSRHFFRVIEVVVALFFTAEYFLRIAVAHKPLRYVFSFYGMIDLLAFLPFYLTIELDLRSLRAFRLFQLLRILKFARYNKALRRFHRALIIAKEELVVFLLFAGIVLYVSSAGIYYFENQAQPDKFTSIFHSLWWAIVTLTTVGYGDIYPITVGGRIFTFFVLLAGLGVVAVPAGLVASALTEARRMED
jgi:voltage-gated potassium channel